MYFCTLLSLRGDLRVMKRKIVICALLFCAVVPLLAQPTDWRAVLTDWLKAFRNEYVELSSARVKRLNINAKTRTITIYTNFAVSAVPFRPATVEQMKSEAAALLAADYPNYKIEIYANGKNIESLVPNAYRATPDRSRLAQTNHQPKAFLAYPSRPYAITNGLQQRNIALWHSHGWFFDQEDGRWRWQRARYFETVEDKLTASYVLPFLLPMLENAGANVLLPRERDTQTHEIIVDNDNDNVNFGSLYCETGGDNYFENSNTGFWQQKSAYMRGESPFEGGSCRLMRTSANSEEAFVEWIPDIPETGDYWVSVAYPYTANNTAAAHYTVYHAGGQTEVVVNQTMGFGTWIYLGKFRFNKGLNADDGKVVLSNRSKSGGVAVADAVRFGGGMGSIARGTDLVPEAVSGRPRHLEAATYWLQWAGAPQEVYLFSEGESDYSDDIAARGLWVNWLNGGSENAPTAVGLKIPVDLALGIHTDAGCRTDTVVGTLGIYTSVDGKTTKYPSGQSRSVSRDLADYVATSFVDDMRRTCAPAWTYRGLWDKSYSESRRPEVPAMLLEMFSHQNYDDMRLGLDPRFKFIACRAIYKGILKFLAEQHSVDYVVQPLPVSDFAAQLFGDTVQLSWRAVRDSLEPTATPTAYVVYTRTDDGGFDNGFLVCDSVCRLAVEPDKIYSYKIVAVNAGGASFPSEILSVCRNSSAKHTVLVVNGFERVSGPEGFATGDFAGFPDWLDDAVPYISDLSYVGAQHEFRRSEAWRDDDAPGWGASNSDFDTRIVAGNSFDYPIVHGRALRNAGYSFVSCSAKAVEHGSVALSDYRAVDWILGEQKQCRLGSDTTQWQFKTFSTENQKKITDFCLQGGAFFASGAHIGTDLWTAGNATEADRYFARAVLKFVWRTDRATQDGRVSGVPSRLCRMSGDFEFNQRLDEQHYCVESPDGIEPAEAKAATAMRYTQNGVSAAVAYQGIYRTFVCGFPFESITSAAQRNALMQQIMRFLVE